MTPSTASVSCALHLMDKHLIIILLSDLKPVILGLRSRDIENLVTTSLNLTSALEDIPLIPKICYGWSYTLHYVTYGFVNVSVYPVIYTHCR